MPRVTHVKRARKDNPVCKKGESYFWWKFRYGGKRYSLTRPRPSQLTRSAYYGTVRSLIEQIEDSDVTSNDDFLSLQDEIASELANLLDETQGSLDNMPESLTYSPTGELLQERIDALEGAQDEVGDADEFEEDEPERDSFISDCQECDGTGEVDEGEGDEECSECKGEGTVDGEHEFQEAMSEWTDLKDDWSTTAKDELIEAVSACEV